MTNVRSTNRCTLGTHILTPEMKSPHLTATQSSLAEGLPSRTSASPSLSSRKTQSSSSAPSSGHARNSRRHGGRISLRHHQSSQVQSTVKGLGYYSFRRLLWRQWQMAAMKFPPPSNLLSGWKRMHVYRLNIRGSKFISLSFIFPTPKIASQEITAI